MMHGLRADDETQRFRMSWMYPRMVRFQNPDQPSVTSRIDDDSVPSSPREDPMTPKTRTVGNTLNSGNSGIGNPSTPATSLSPVAVQAAEKMSTHANE